MAAKTARVFALIAIGTLLSRLDVSASPTGDRLESASPVSAISRTTIEHLPPSRELDLSILSNNVRAGTQRVRTGADGGLRLDIVRGGGRQPHSVLIDGVPVLPDNSFGVIRAPIGPSLADIQSIDVLRQPFGAQYGQVVDPIRYVSRLVDPFMMACRAGAPTELNLSERYFIETPATRVGAPVFIPGLDAEFAGWNSDTFALPERTGYGIGLDAGPALGKTRDVLNDLSRTGKIEYFEPDPCWRYRDAALALSPPRSCPANSPAFEDKAVVYQDAVVGMLKDSSGGKPIGDAWIRVGPLSPTPFHDPGEQPGDELPPTIVRSGLDGRYHVPLQGLSGVIELEFARGCASYGTLAIADRPGQPGIAGAPPGFGISQARDVARPIGGTSSPPVAPPPASTPRDQPPDGMRVCGPDITDWVLGTLQFMVETFTAWDEPTKDAKCASLYGLQADGAWEMRHMGPFDSNRATDPHLYFGRYFPDRCAVPRWPCGATVQFLGVCLDAQIVNYVAWGAMNQLCDNQDIGMLAHLARDRFVNVVRGIRDAVENKSLGKLKLGKGPAYDAQNAMSHVGELFVKQHGGLAARKSLLQSLVKVYVDEHPEIARMDGFDCQLICDRYATDIGKLDSYDWGFNWGLEWYDRRGGQLAKP